MDILVYGTRCLYEGERYQIVRYWGYSGGRHIYAIEKEITRFRIIVYGDQLVPLHGLNNASIHTQVLKE